MGVRVIVVGLLLGHAATAFAITVDDLSPAQGYTIRSIRIEGAGEVSASAIRDVMLTRLPPWWKPWERWLSRARATFNPDLFRTDLERVRTLLRESGHYDATVEHDLEVRGDEVVIVLRVAEGPAARLQSVELVGRDVPLPASDETALRAVLPSSPGDVFTQEGYDRGRAQIEAFYQDQGFAYAKVDKRARVDTATERVQVTYTIERGPPAVFGTTRITGLDKVDEGLVRREIGYRAGAPWDPHKIDATQASVFGLKLFRSVTVRAANLEERSGVVDVAIDVEEGPPREFQAGAGYGLEDGPRGQVRWQHYDFLGGGRQLGFRVKASEIEQAVESEFRQPFFLGPGQTLVVPLTQTREDELAFTVTRIRLAPRIERQILPDLKGVFGYNIEYDDLTNVPLATERCLEGGGDCGAPEDDQPFPPGDTGFQGRGFVSSVTGLVERNTTIDLLDPKQGSVLTLAAEVAGGPLQGDFSFYRGTVEAKKYWPVLGTRVFATRFVIGGGDAYGQSPDLPLFRRFYAGGINSTRGYARWKLGPLNEFDKPVGGRSLLEGSVELRTPIWKKIGGVVFFDVGEVRRKPFSYTTGDLQFGAGVGLRYDTVVGPLRVDLGFPFGPPPGEASWQVHFSIGQAF